MHGHGGFGGGHGFFHPGDFMWLVIFGIVLVGVGIYVSRKKPVANVASEDTAILILKEQFAKGEIDEATYAERKRVLSE